MATRRPICTVSGRLNELPVGDFVAGQVSGQISSAGTPTIEAWLPVADPRGGTGSAAYGSGGCALAPLVLKEAMTFDRIGMVVTTLAVGGIVNLAIYGTASSSDVYPGARLLLTDDFDGSSTGLKTATINLSLGPGFYYGALYKNSSTLAVRAAGNTMQLASSTGSTNFIFFSSSATLANPFPSGASLNTSAAPLIILRRSA